MKPRSVIRTATSAAMVAMALLAACSDAAVGPVEPEVPPVYSVSVTPSADSLILGDQVTLRAKPRAADGIELVRPVVWTSENVNVATVSDDGVMTAVGVGEVAIRATSEGRFGRAMFRILPKPPAVVAEVRISVDNEIALAWNGSADISATAYDADSNVVAGRPVQWQSNRTAVATISASGHIVAVSFGTAIISAVIDGVVSHVGVRVLSAPVVDVTIETVTFGLEVGESFQFGALITRANGSGFHAPVQWTSSTPSVARIAGADLWTVDIEAVAIGETVLTATFDGVSDTMTVRVIPAPTHDLIYTKHTGSAAEIHVLGLSPFGVAPVRINAGNASRSPSPSPDGSQLVFAVSQSYQTGEGIQDDLYIVNRDGLNMRWLTRMPGREDSPKWSPDGTKILFHGVVGARADIYTINVDGTALFNVTASTPAMTDRREPSWSPDGSKVAFIGAVDGQHKVWVVNADGSNARQVTTDAGFDMTPTWSPDGAKIAFVRYHAASPVNGDDIMIVSTQGGAATRYTMTGDQRQPAWSPDGRYIAFAGTTVAGSGLAQLYTMRADGTGVRRRTIDPSWGGGAVPAWIARQ